VQQPGPEPVVAGGFRREDLDRHRAVQALVVRQADDAQVTLADLALQPVTGDPAQPLRVPQLTNLRSRYG
jgi:hypothetical protein